MTWTPQLRTVCGRCGKPRGLLSHVCVSNSRRRATLVPEFSFGTCPKCKRQVGNPLTHVCHPRSDFKRRKARAARQAEKHDYQACSDKDCPRPLCAAYRTGYKTGYAEGEADGFGAGYAAGYSAGFSAGAASAGS
jgi:hypothetical protein